MISIRIRTLVLTCNLPYMQQYCKRHVVFENESTLSDQFDLRIQQHCLIKRDIAISSSKSTFYPSSPSRSLDFAILEINTKSSKANNIWIDPQIWASMHHVASSQHAFSQFQQFSTNKSALQVASQILLGKAAARLNIS